MYSQVFQDEVAFKLIGGYGFYVDIGAGDGFNDPNGGNSLFLEQNGWDGILIEGCPHRSAVSKKGRKGISFCARIPDIAIKTILDSNNCPKIIDYLSIDIEPVSFLALQEFPLDEYRFKLLTFEHDLYLDPVNNIRDKEEAFCLLSARGYVRFAEDVETPHIKNAFFEDWYIDPAYFDSDFLLKNNFRQQTGKFILDNLA